MRILLLSFTLCLFLSAGCSLKVLPVPVESGIIDEKKQSQSLTRNNIIITAGSADTQLHNYNLEGSVSSFFVAIDNQSNDEFAVDQKMFLLIDNDGTQYSPLTPDHVKEIISRDSYYLIPYPYVGFYYTEDYEKSSFYNTFNTQLPYYYEVYPQDLYTKAIVSGTVIPKGKVNGLLYFKIDLNTKKNVKLLVYKAGASKSSPPDFTFPFKIEN